MKNVVKAILILSGFIAISAFAQAPHGVYVNALGGYDYLADSELGTIQTTGTFVQPTVSPNMTEGSAGFSGRGALGYYFYSNPVTSWAYGMELGYNYLSPGKNYANLTTTRGDEPYFISSNAQTDAWAGDLDFIVSKSVSEHISLFGKMGLGYEQKTEKFTAMASGTNGSATNLYDTNTVKTLGGIGAVGGLGLQYALTQNVALQTELDAMKGSAGFGYAQLLAGLSFAF